MTKKLSVNPWFSMWLRPRLTIKEIIKYNPSYLMPLLVVLIGISRVLDRGGLYVSAFFVQNPLLTLFGIVTVGTVAGLIVVYFFALLLELTGKFMGGKGLSGNLIANLDNF